MYVLMSAKAQIAEGDTPVIALESRSGESSVAENAVLHRLRDELQKLGVMAQPSAIIEAVGGFIARPGITDVHMSATEIDRLVESGRAAYVKGNFKEGFAISTRAIRLIRENPGLLVLNSENTDMVFRAYLVLAMCLNRLGQDQLADSVFQELVLMYPTFPFVQVVQVYYGPTVEEKCRKVFRRLRSMEVGDLTIRVTDEHAMIFVDGQMRGLGSASVTGLLVGTHYVFVRTSTKGLRYEPEVDPNTVTRLEIIPEFDTALKASDEGIGGIRI
jgi:hypothetical protein